MAIPMFISTEIIGGMSIPLGCVVATARVRIAETLCFDYKRMNNVDVRVAHIFNTYNAHARG